MENYNLFTDPASRLFWGSLLCAFFMGLCLTRGGLRERVKTLLNPRVWLHPSARVDYLLTLFSLVLKALLAVPFYYGVYGLAALISVCLKMVFGAPSEAAFSAPVLVLLFGFTAYVFEDFARYLLHYAQHRIPFLWRFHKVHHSAVVLTPVTVHRVHPVEMLTARFRSFLVLGVISGVFYYVSLDKLSLWTILGVDAFGFLSNFLGSNLRHSHVRWSYGIFERVLISPSQHQNHHSKGKSGAKNLGSTFSLWDQLFGTFEYSVKGRKPFRYGLSREHLNHRLTFFGCLLGPFRG